MKINRSLLIAMVLVASVALIPTGVAYAINLAIIGITAFYSLLGSAISTQLSNTSILICAVMLASILFWLAFGLGALGNLLGGNGLLALGLLTLMSVFEQLKEWIALSWSI